MSNHPRQEQGRPSDHLPERGPRERRDSLSWCDTCQLTCRSVREILHHWSSGGMVAVQCGFFCECHLRRLTEPTREKTHRQTDNRFLATEHETRDKPQYIMSCTRLEGQIENEHCKSCSTTTSDRSHTCQPIWADGRRSIIIIGGRLHKGCTGENIRRRGKCYGRGMEGKVHGR